MNLDTLRRKRIKRLGIRSAAGYTGQRRIFFVLDRATRKFHGDINLWVQYIEYARQQKAYKKLSLIFADALRKHPANADLWIYAAKYVMDDHADMMLARSYMQRGLRFCESSRKLWISYAKLELIYVAKLVGRQRILGLDHVDESTRGEPESSSMDPDADEIKLPQVTGEDVQPDEAPDTETDLSAIRNLDSSPALSGAVPLAIYDSAMKKFDNDDRLSRDFYDMVLEFDDIPCLRKVLGHIVDVMLSARPASSNTLICYIRFPTAGISLTSSEFPRALAASLARLKEHQSDRGVAKETINWLQPLAATDSLDPAVQKVIRATIHKSERVLLAQL